MRPSISLFRLCEPFFNPEVCTYSLPLPLSRQGTMMHGDLQYRNARRTSTRTACIAPVGPVYSLICIVFLSPYCLIPALFDLFTWRLACLHNDPICLFEFSSPLFLPESHVSLLCNGIVGALLHCNARRTSTRTACMVLDGFRTCRYTLLYVFPLLMAAQVSGY